MRGSAHAQVSAPSSDADAMGRLAFEAGRTAYDNGELAEALAQFERAYALSKRPELLYNIGRAAESNANIDRAIAAYSAYVEALPRAENRKFAETRLGQLRQLQASRPPVAEKGSPAIAVPLAPPVPAPSSQPSATERRGRLVIVTTPETAELWIDGRLVPSTERPTIMLEGVEHVVEAHAPGHSPERRLVQVGPGQTETLDIRLAPTIAVPEVPRPQERPQNISAMVYAPWWNGIGVAGMVRYEIPVARNGFIPSVNDQFSLEPALGFGWQRSYNLCDSGYSDTCLEHGKRTTLTPALYGVWSFHVTSKFRPYASIGLGVDIGINADDHWIGKTSNFFFDAAAGLFYRFSAPVGLRAEVGSGGPKLGLSFYF